MALNLLRNGRNLAKHRFRPSFAYNLNDDRNKIVQSRPIGTTSLGFREICEGRTSLCGSIFARNMSTVSTAAATASEISLATADSCFPVATVQHLIDSVHCFTGLNWWASIAVTTILVRAITVPFMMQHPFRDLWILFESSPAAAKLREKRFAHVIKEYDGRPYDAPFRAKVIPWSVCLSFYFAINNMVATMPSLKSGGALWFTDITTADYFLILPALSGLIYLRRKELFRAGDDVKWTMKFSTRKIKDLTIHGEYYLLPALATIISLFFPKAFFFYWIPSNLFMIIFRTAMVRRPPPSSSSLVLQKFLGILTFPGILKDVNGLGLTANPNILL